jgi:hypothetical protein
VLCAIALLSVSITACGGTHTVASRTSAKTETTTTSAATNPEERKLDADKDSDLGSHDEDGSDKPVPPDPDRDNDADSDGTTRYDSDDSSVLDYGHAATASDKRQIATLIRRYYTADAEEDGAKACSMLYSTFAEAVPEDYGTSPPGPPWARGTTCATVLNLFFKHTHAEIAARLPKLMVSRVRLDGRQGIVVMSFDAMSDREIHVQREGHIWKILSLVDKELP